LFVHDRLLAETDEGKESEMESGKKKEKIPILYAPPISMT